MDGGVENFEGDIVMMVPLRSPVRSVWLIHGDSVPPKVTVGAPDIDPGLLLDLANGRRADGPYLHAERVRFGMLALHGRPHQGPDSSFSGGGASVACGTAPAPAPPGERAEAGADAPAQSSAWLVKQNGRKFVLAVAAGPDSFQVATAIAPAMSGRFAVYPLAAGQMTLDENYLVPGWRVLVDPAPAPAPSGPGARH